MQLQAHNGLQNLEQGQLWECAQGYVYIAEMGKRLLHYKLLKHPEQKAVITRMTGLESMQDYLKANDARLLKPGSRH
jgi:hypothetical protein